MINSYVASYDFGTSSVKAVLVDFQGNVISSSTAGYSLLTPNADWAEQSPEAYWDAVCEATKQALAKADIDPENVKGVVFGTQWKGIIPLDAQGEVLYNAIIWLDGRAGIQAAKLNARMNTDEFCNKDYWPKLMWFKEELPEIYERTACFLEINSFLKYKATGIKAVDLTNSFTRSIDEKLQSYYDIVLAAAELDPDKFPPIVMPSENIGGLTAAAAKALGLAEGTPVFGGCGDIPAIAIGSGCSSLGSVHIYLGSSGWLGTVVPERSEGIGELYQSLDRGKELMIYTLQSAGMTLNWAIDQLYHYEKENLKDNIFDFINKEIADIAPGSMNMIATPWLHGERPPLSKNAKAVFFNVTNLHDRRHFINAVLEGICYHLRWKIDIYKKETGKTIDTIRVVGGGASSDHWMQMMSNILQTSVEIPANVRHAGSIGTAYCALIGLGQCSDFEEAAKMAVAVKTFLPQKEYAAMYDKLFSVFQQLFYQMESMFDQLNS
ncbi:MAG: xylulokinase [Pseudomonadota bacterium]